MVCPPTVMLVIAALQAELSVKVTSKGLSTVAPTAAVSEITGAGMLNVLDVAPVNPEELKLIVAPVTEAKLDADKPLKVAVPEFAATVAVPPNVQLPASTAAVTLAVLVVVFPY
jgi:hypothetical protein